MCIKSICNLISAFTQAKQTPHQQDNSEQQCCHKKPPARPCYETAESAKKINYEFTRAAIYSQ